MRTTRMKPIGMKPRRARIWALSLLLLLAACQPEAQDANQQDGQAGQSGQSSQNDAAAQQTQGGLMNQSALAGSGVLKTQTLDLPAFTSLDVRSGLKLVYHADAKLAKPIVKLTIDDNLLAAIDAQVSDGMLSVRLKQPVKARDKTLEITAPPLRALILQGGSQAKVDKLTGLPAYELELRGGSKLKVDKLEGKSLKIGLHGGSQLELAGQVEKLETDTLAGGSQAELEDLKATDAQLRLQGGSEARVHVSRKIDVDMAGGSKVYYAGTAQVEEHGMGGGSRVMALLMKN